MQLVEMQLVAVKLMHHVLVQLAHVQLGNRVQMQPVGVRSLINVQLQPVEQEHVLVPVVVKLAGRGVIGQDICDARALVIVMQLHVQEQIRVLTQIKLSVYVQIEIVVVVRELEPAIMQPAQIVIYVAGIHVEMQLVAVSLQLLVGHQLAAVKHIVHV